MSPAYKETYRWEQGGWRAQVTFQTQWDQLCAKEAIRGSQTTLQGKAGCLITVIDDWEQLHTNATLLKPDKLCQSFQSSTGP